VEQNCVTVLKGIVLLQQCGTELFYSIEGKCTVTAVCNRTVFQYLRELYCYSSVEQNCFTVLKRIVLLQQCGTEMCNSIEGNFTVTAVWNRTVLQY
jgi:hypothetical protein